MTPPLPPAPGDSCTNVRDETHLLVDPTHDRELQRAFAWLSARPVDTLMGAAIRQAVDYVLDGGRTGRFDLTDSAVDSDERRTVGTKLQYHVLELLELPRLRSPDTVIDGVPVDIKGTVQHNWSIPKEAQCRLCLCIKINASSDTHQSWLMRTHRAWLHGGIGNGDAKRGVIIDALRRYAIPLYDEQPYPQNPLKLLTAADQRLVFSDRGQERRLLELFRALPDVVMPRSSLQTVCFGRIDPIRRARAIKARMLANHGLVLLCGTWAEDLALARACGHDLAEEAWVAVPAARVPPAPRTP